MMKFLRLFVAMCVIFQISGFAPHKHHLSSSSKSVHISEPNSLKNFLVGGLMAVTILLPFQNAFAETIMEKNANFVYKLPPIDRKNPDRCKLLSSSIGQANAARDSLYDLRECDIRGQNAEGKDQSGMIASDADFSGVSFKEGQISKAYARNSKFIGCDFTNAVVDRASFDGSDLSKSVFANAVLSGTSFKGSNLADTDFTDAYLGPFDLKNLCLNPTLSGTNPKTKVDTKESAGCFEK